MDVKVEVLDNTPVNARDTRPARWRFTVEVDATDDPHGHLWGMAALERLAPALRLYGQGQEITPTDREDLWDVLVNGARAAGRFDVVLGAVMWAARDTYGWSWGEIASATDMGRKAVRNTVERVRANYADRGLWRDAHGLHLDSPEVSARRGAARAAELAARRSLRDAE